MTRSEHGPTRCGKPSTISDGKMAAEGGYGRWESEAVCRGGYPLIMAANNLVAVVDGERQVRPFGLGFGQRRSRLEGE